MMAFSGADITTECTPSRRFLWRNSQQRAMALLAAGCLLLMSMTFWAFVGATPITVHAISLLGGTAGGVAGGLLCESAGLVVILAGHLTGAGIGAAGLIGLAHLARKL